MEKNTDQNPETKSDMMHLFQELQEKYENLEKDFKALQSSKKEIDQINKNVQDIMEQVRRLAEQQGVGSGRMMFQNPVRMMLKPLRKMAVGTTRLMLATADKTRQGTGMIRENIEDIIAEAQYENQKRGMQMMPNQQS